MVISPPIKIVYMGSYYADGMTHATNIWMLLILNMDVFIECGCESEMEMVAFTLFHIDHLLSVGLEYGECANLPIL
jgi:hypothetical protein